MPMGPREFERSCFSRQATTPSCMKFARNHQHHHQSQAMPAAPPLKIHRRGKGLMNHLVIVIEDDEENQNPQEQHQQEARKNKRKKAEEEQKPEVIVIDDDEGVAAGGGGSSSSSSSSSSSDESDVVHDVRASSSSRNRVPEEEEDEELQFVERRNFFYRPRWWNQVETPEGSSECEVISRQQWSEAGVRRRDGGKKRVKSEAQSPAAPECVVNNQAMESLNTGEFPEVRSPKKNSSSVHSSAVNREVLRQAPEFKEADEQEWASRQLELQKQALEVQKLKRKRKAEAERKMAMENRQKQRVQEMRETQIKEEQTLGIKEELRGQIQAGLERIASQCGDLASLLRRLGINLGAASPSIQQVNAGYKQALFRFHPDRASTSGDIRSQVEAEEKFKLISRMKSVLRPIAS